MALFVVKEGEPTWLPGLTLEAIPEPFPTKLRLLTRADGSLGLLADGVVGSMALRDGSTLQILPKIGQVPFLQMLLRSLEPTDRLSSDFGDPATYGVDQETGFGWLVARTLCESADLLMRTGLSSEREAQRVWSTMVTGHLDALPTMISLARHEAKPVVSTNQVRSLDTAEHRLMRAALHNALPMLDGAERERAIATYSKWSRRTGSGELRSEDVTRVQERIAREWYGGSRPAYRRAMVLALTVLGLMGVSLDGSADLEGDALLMNSADVFESYVRASVAAGLGPRDYVVTKGGSSISTLYLDGSFRLQPDVVVEKDGIVQMVLDAKYKNPSADDHYQMVMYLTALNVDRGVLVTPHGGESDAVVTKYQTPSGLRIYELGLPLAVLPTCEELLTAVLSDYL